MPTSAPTVAPLPEPTLGDLPWVKDGVTGHERGAIQFFSNIERADPAWTRTILGFEWFTDDINSVERDAIGFFSVLAALNPSVVQPLLDFRWVADDITLEEFDNLLAIGGDRFRYAPVTQLLIGFPWLADGISKHERTAIDGFYNLARTDLSLAQSLMSRPWITDGISTQEGLVVDFLSARAQFAWDLDSGVISYGEDKRIIVDVVLSLEPTVEYAEASLGASVMRSLEYILALPDRRRLKQLNSQLWLGDGLTSEEMALIVTLRSVADLSKASETAFQGLMESGPVHSETFFLSSVGEVKLFVVGWPPFREDREVFEVLRRGIEVIEGFMHVPWDQPNVIALLAPELNPDGNFGKNFGTHINARADQEAQQAKATLYHELAHYYLTYDNAGFWLAEGGSHFLRDYVLHITEGASLQSSYTNAQNVVAERCIPYGLINIHEWNMAKGAETAQAIVEDPRSKYCHYYLGESFLLGMYKSLGHEVVSSSLRDLYRISEAKGSRVTEDEIYQVFLSNTPLAQKAEFLDLYRRMHGRPIPDS